MTTQPISRVCKNGHSYFKTSDCPTCPACKAARKPSTGFLALLSAPARRALENKGITTLPQLAEWREAEVLQWHGLGPGSMPKLRQALQEKGLAFKR